MKEMDMRTILDKINKRFSDEDVKKIHEQYRLPDNTLEKMTGKRHRLVTGMAVNGVLRHIAANGGTEDEIARALEYVLVCIDANKHHLDYKKCYQDLEIGKLLEKYGVKRTKTD